MSYNHPYYGGASSSRPPGPSDDDLNEARQGLRLLKAKMRRQSLSWQKEQRAAEQGLPAPGIPQPSHPSYPSSSYSSRPQAAAARPVPGASRVSPGQIARQPQPFSPEDDTSMLPARGGGIGGGGGWSARPLQMSSRERLGQGGDEGRGEGVAVSGVVGGRGFEVLRQPVGAASGGVGAASGGGIPNEEDAVAEPVDLTECDGCGRSFRPEALAKHRKVCQKVFQQKRKPFDVAALRVSGVDGGPEALRRLRHDQRKAKRKTGQGSGGDAPIKKTPAWKQQSEAFRAAIAASRATTDEARQEAQARLDAVGPDPSMVSCPHCGRTFNQDAAKRHIPICEKTFAKKGGRLAKGGGTLAAAGGGMAASASAPSFPKRGGRR
ncbi:unnamed protein product [Vitrella brassicaformis CCMP3155]|uniref:C2HC/C3H-type domain-containing protein n=1 Tax=Vitrella brassicaformis (strain CCMP3155) TaxID=1169540 RepID=A0A0G4F5D8_VITBC|nr:unnamed protein product [Vitrella brassicaformis CCMP3155]|eukprot:CEM07060.1 unnamed protein product [Vitrella brassicaformis CCMP3155]